jgi:tripartite-type tricarboxylate transporter receptor subunit TctC
LSEGALRLLVGFSQGSVSNIVARLLTPALEQALGQAVHIDQCPGENGAIAAERLAKAAPDGLTLGMAVPTHLIGSLIGEVQRYDPLADFAAVAMIARNPMVLAVGSGLGVASVQELITLARTRPGELAYGASAVGGGPHLGAVLFSALTGVSLERRVYDETNVLFDDLAEGRIALTFNNPTSVLPQARLGRLKMLAVTSALPSALVPGVPTLASSGVPGYEYTSWVGVLAPAGVPPLVQARLHEGVRRAAASAEVLQGLQALGLDPVRDTAGSFGMHLRAEWQRWRAFAFAHRGEFPGLRVMASD